MKVITNCIVKPILLLLLLPAIAHAQPAVSPTLGALGAVRLESVHVAEIGPQGVSISVELTLTPTRTITVESVRLSSLRMNGLPLYAAPLTSPLQLTAGMPTAVPPLVVKVLFRDFSSLAPLRKMLEDESVHVQGQAQAVVRVGFLEKLALHTQHPIVSVPINETLPVSISGPPFARQAALGILALADSALQTASAASKHAPGMESEWVEALKAKAPGALVQVETSYTLIENKTPFPVLFDQLAFRLNGVQPLLTTPEASAPWEYDPDFLGRIHSKEAKLDSNALNIQLTSLDPEQDNASILQLSKGDFTLQKRGSSDEDKILVSSKSVVAVKVKRRAGNALLLLVPAHPGTPEGFTPAPEEVLHADHWEKLALFRLVPPTSGTAQTTPVVELIQLSGHREGTLIRLETPVDPAAFGSPIMTPEGVLGMVQDETTGIFLPTDLPR